MSLETLLITDNPPQPPKRDIKQQTTITTKTKTRPQTTKYHPFSHIKYDNIHHIIHQAHHTRRSFHLPYASQKLPGYTKHNPGVLQVSVLQIILRNVTILLSNVSACLGMSLAVTERPVPDDSLPY